MADVVIGIAASHAPNLANPSLIKGVNEEQYATVKAGFAQARTLLEQARPDAIVIFSADHFDRCFYDNLPPFLVAVGEEAEGPVNEWLKIPKVKLRVAGELGRFLVSEGLENGVDFASSAELPLDHAEVVPLSYLTPRWDIPIVPIVVNAFGGQRLCAADAEPEALRPGRGLCPRSRRAVAGAEAGGSDRDRWAVALGGLAGDGSGECRV
jgi:hypothetical protein